MVKKYWHSRFIVRTIIITLITLLLLFFVVDFAVPFKVPRDYSLLITDCNGEPVHAFLNEADKWRMECNYEELPADVVKAIVHKEDKYFFWHVGVNPVAMVRALFQNSVAGERKSGRPPSPCRLFG